MARLPGGVKRSRLVGPLASRPATSATASALPIKLVRAGEKPWTPPVAPPTS